MSRDLERQWRGSRARGAKRTVATDRRFQRPQHVIYNGWKTFDTPLKLKEGIDLAALAQQANEYGLELVAQREPNAPHIRKLVEEDRTPRLTEYVPYEEKPRDVQMTLDMAGQMTTEEA